MYNYWLTLLQSLQSMGKSQSCMTFRYIADYQVILILLSLVLSLIALLLTKANECIVIDVGRIVVR